MENIAENFPDISFIDDSTVDEVMQQMINDYQERYKELTGKDVSLAQANPYRLLIYACAMQIYQAMQYADYAGKMSFLKYAHDEYLDNLAALRGLSRKEATAATTILKFSIESALTSAVAIPAGCKVTNGNDLYFATDEYAEIAAGETEVSVSATCTEAGVAGNGFEVGEINVIVNTLAYVVTVMNTSKTSGGKGTETDDDLKDRIYNIPNSYSTAGPTGSYEYHAKEVDSSIVDAVVTSPSAGVVNIYILTEDGIPDKTLLQKVLDYLDDETIRPLTDSVSVLAPTEVTCNITLTYYIASSDKSAVSTIQDEVQTAVSIYETWQTEKIGRDINPSYLIQKVMEAGAKRVTIDSPEHTVLSNTSIAKIGTVTITYGGIEDD